MRDQLQHQQMNDPLDVQDKSDQATARFQERQYEVRKLQALERIANTLDRIAQKIERIEADSPDDQDDGPGTFTSFDQT